MRFYYEINYFKLYNITDLEKLLCINIRFKELQYCKWADPKYAGVPDEPVYKGRITISLQVALQLFSDFLNGMRSQFPFSYDHALGFTR